MFRSALTTVELSYDRSSSGPGSYAFTMKPNIVVDNRESTVNQALQTIERRVNELGVAEPIVARHSAADQILVQLPGVTDVNRAKEIIRSTALLELTLVEQGPFPDEASARQAVRRQRAARHPHPAGPQRGGGPRPTGHRGLLRRAPRSGGDRARPPRGAAADRRVQPAVGGLQLQQRRRPEVRRLYRPRTSAASSAVVLDGRVQTAPTIQSRIDYEGQITGTFSSQEAADLALTLRSGALPASLTYLEERTVGPIARRGVHPRRRDRGGRGAAAGDAVHALLLQAGRVQRAHLDRGEPDHPARPDGLPGRGDDAPGHRGLHPDDRHGRRLERPDLRAHQGRTGHGARRQAGGGGGLRSRLPHHSRHPRRLAHLGRLPVPVRHGARFAGSPPR